VKITRVYKDMAGGKIMYRVAGETSERATTRSWKAIRF